MATINPKAPKYAAMAQGANLMQSVGFFSSLMPGTQPIGNNKAGQQQYASSALLESNDGSLGTKTVGVLQKTLDPFGVFTGQDKSKLNALSTMAGDAAFITQLTDMRARGDTKGFVDTILAKTNQPIISAITKDPQNQAGLGSAYSAYNLYNSWDRMSPAQRGLGVANLGIQGYKFSTGENLADKPIISSNTATGNPGLTVGQGLGLFQAGYNTYSLAKNWNQFNGIQKVSGVTGNAASIANMAKSFNMLGAGTTGAEVANVSAQSLAASGWSQAPSLGIGAVTGEVGSAIPNGYTAITQAGGKVVAAPSGSAASAQGATSTGAGSVLGTAAGAAGVALGTYQVYKGWGTGGKQGALNGALGGSAIAAGLYGMGTGMGVVTMTNPYLLGAVVAVSIAGNLAKSGKHKDQTARDGVRGVFQKNKAVDDDFNFTLPDGTKASIGIDSSGQHKVYDKTKVPQGHELKDSLSAYDTDYTNDLDYSAGMAGIALSRIVTGGKATNVDQVGSQIGNAALTNIGYGKEFNQGNFGSLMNNFKAIYSQSGIKSKADAYQLANQAYAEHRINESDLVAAHQAFNMVFDEGSYTNAQQLLGGRFKGLEVAATTPEENTVKIGASTRPANFTPIARTPVTNYTAPLSKEAARSRNRELYQGASV